MAKKIKFALEMADGAKVRTNIEELREHFDIQSVLGYFVSGKLQEWLADRYYDEEAEKIGELSKDDQELNRKLCSILGVDYMETDKADIETLQRINEKKAILRQATSDTNIIDNAEWVAFDQEELADLLDEDATTIYLYGDKFNIPVRRKNMTYIGVNNPQISINAKEYKDIESNDIKFVNVTLPEVLRPTQDTENKDKTEYKSLDFFDRIRRKYGDNEAKAEKLFLENKFDEAEILFVEEAEKNNVRAYYFLEQYYLYGYGSYPVMAEKIKEFRNIFKDSESPFLKLQFLYGLSQETGEFEHEFLKIKDDLFREALEGDPFICGEVIDLKMREDYDVPRDIYDQCVKIAISNKNCHVLHFLGREAYSSGDLNLAKQYNENASKRGFPLAQVFLAVRCSEEGDEDKAFILLKAAADKKCPEALAGLAEGYYNQEDYYEAFKWAQKGAEKNYCLAQSILARCYVTGNGVEEDDDIGFLWGLKAGKQGDVYGQYLVGLSFYYGKGIYTDEEGNAYESDVTDYEEAFKWFQKAARQGDPHSMYFLGECYYHGHGIEEDLAKAREWYKKAANAGDEDAMEALESM